MSRVMADLSVLTLAGRTEDAADKLREQVKTAARFADETSSKRLAASIFYGYADAHSRFSPAHWSLTIQGMITEIIGIQASQTIILISLVTLIIKAKRAGQDLFAMLSGVIAKINPLVGLAEAFNKITTTLLRSEATPSSGASEWLFSLVETAVPSAILTEIGTLVDSVPGSPPPTGGNNNNNNNSGSNTGNPFGFGNLLMNIIGGSSPLGWFSDIFGGSLGGGGIIDDIIGGIGDFLGGLFDAENDEAVATAKAKELFATATAAAAACGVDPHTYARAFDAAARRFSQNAA